MKFRKMYSMNIYFAKISFPETHGAKYRPVIYLEQHHGIATVLRVTSSYNPSSWVKRHFYYPLKHLYYAGLPKRSYVDLTCTTELPIHMLKERVGIVDLEDRIDLCKFALIEHKLHDKPKYRH